MDFGEALKLLRKGKSLRRKGWNGKGIFIKMKSPEDSSDMTHDYIYIDTTGLQTDNDAAPKDRVPWLASQTDLLADDWEVVKNRLDISIINANFKNEKMTEYGSDEPFSATNLSFDILAHGKGRVKSFDRNEFQNLMTRAMDKAIADEIIGIDWE